MKKGSSIGPKEVRLSRKRFDRIGLAQDAEKLFDLAAKNNPSSPHVYLAWGQMRSQGMDDMAGARAVFTRGTDLCPRPAPLSRSPPRGIHVPPRDLSLPYFPAIINIYLQKFGSILVRF